MEEGDAMSLYSYYYFCISIVLSALVFTGSILICYVILRYKSTRNFLDYYLFNQAIVDILSLSIAIVPQVYERNNYSATYQWLTIFIMFTYWGISALTMMAVAVEKYIGVCHSFKSVYTLTLSRTVKIIVSIWLLSIVYIAAYVRMKLICDTNAARWVCHVVSFVFTTESVAIFFFLLPTVVILVLHIVIRVEIWKSTKFPKFLGLRNFKVRTELKLSEVVTLEFFLFSVPFHLVMYKIIDNPVFLSNNTGVSVFMLAILINLLCKSTNPFVYYCFSREFKKAFKMFFATTCAVSETSQKDTPQQRIKQKSVT